MASDTNTISDGLQSSGAAAPASRQGLKNNEQIGKDEFLQLLVTQLKNQDPLDPMNPEQFAVNLAQFSQVEHGHLFNLGDQGLEFSWHLDVFHFVRHRNCIRRFSYL